MGSRNFIQNFTKATRCSLYRNQSSAACCLLSTKISKDKVKLLLPEQKYFASRYSTSCHLWNEKKVGLFLFGRPPEPNLEVGKRSIEENVENLNPLSLEILDKLHNAESPKDILHIYKENKQFMTDIHTSRALQQLAEVWELNTENLPIQIGDQKALQTTKPLFRELCVSCLRDTQHMDDFTFLSSLKSILKIGVPENSVLVHTMLTHSQHRLNRMSSASLAVFCQILNQLKLNSELSQALQKAVALIIPKMVIKADGIWQCVTYLRMAGDDISFINKMRLVHKLTALLRLDPSVTLEDCCQVVSTLSSLNLQSRETVKAVCEHLHAHFKDLSDFEVCRLIKGLGKFRYLDTELMSKLSNSICQSFEELASESLTNLFNGLTNGRFYHPELANLGCRHIVESASDEDLKVDICLIAATSRYFARLNLKPDQLKVFIHLCHKACEVFFTESVNGAQMQEKIDALDALYHLCLLNSLKSPFTRPIFEARAKEYLQVGNLRIINVQKITLQIATLRCMEGVYDPDRDDQITTNPLPNPWQITQRHDHSLEAKLVLKSLEDSVASSRWDANVELGGGLTADFVISSLGNYSKPTCKGLALNILHHEGQAVNQNGHLVGLYHLKDRLLKNLGYQPLWIKANRLSVNRPEGKESRSGALSYLKETLQQNGVIPCN